MDLLKAICALFVVIVHTCYNGYVLNPVGSVNWLSTVFWGTAIRGGVPIFLMCTGALLLRPEKQISMKKIYTQMLPRILVALLAWAAMYELFHLRGQYSWETLRGAIKRLVLFDHEYHLYYLHIILLVYVFLPILKAFTALRDKRLTEYALVIWFVLGIVYPTVKTWWPVSLLTGIPKQYLINMTYSSMGYMLLGWYLKEFPIRRRAVYPAMFLSGFVIMFFGTWYLSARSGSLDDSLLGGMTVWCFLKSVGLFGIFASWPAAQRRGEKTLPQYLCRASFCVYLAHPLFIYLERLVGLDVDILPCIVSIPLLAVLNMACCVAVYFVLSKIPVVKKWLV